MTTATATTIEGLTAGTWNVDKAHSTIGFTARHLMVSKVRGYFSDFEGSIEVGEDVLDSKVEATVQLASVTTGEEKRDEHLRSADFFEVDKYPTMTFKTTKIEGKGDEYKMYGDLTVHGTTKPVEFDLEFNGVNPDPWGGTRAGFSASTEINRKDWGLAWNVAMETGGVLVSEKVKIELEVQLVKA